MRGDDLGTDADRGLLGRAGADVEPGGRHQPVELDGIADAGLGEADEALGMRRPAAQHADVADARRQRADHGGNIELGVVGEDAHRVASAERGTAFGEQRRRPRDQHLVGHREAPSGGEHLTCVAHRDPVAEQLGDVGQGRREVDGAEDPHLRWGRVAVDEHLDDRGTGEVLGRGLAVRPEVPHARACRIEFGQRVACRNSIELRIAKCPERRLAGRDEQLGSRGWPTHDGDEGDRLLRPQPGGQLVEQRASYHSNSSR